MIQVGYGGRNQSGERKNSKAQRNNKVGKSQTITD